LIIIHILWGNQNQNLALIGLVHTAIFVSKTANDIKRPNTLAEY